MNESNTFFIKTKDFSVSGEDFELHYNKAKDMLLTTPSPAKKDLADYYDSSQYDSHTTQKRSVFDWAYYIVRGYTLKRKVRLISQFKVQKKTLLDYGAGVGSFVRVARKSGWDSVGVEASKQARSAANQALPESVFKTEWVKKLPSKSQSIITLWHVLEHLPNLNSSIQEFKRLLADDGRLIVAVPNYKSYDAKYYKAFWAAYDVPRHLWHFSPKSIARLFSQFDFELESTHPMLFDAYYVSLLSSKNKHGRMKIINSLWTGFKSNLLAKQSGDYSSLIYVLKRAEN
ncbi:MAG: class I SAM-dependent methyltransferase [Bacteroidetes bacterium]|jgi:2-polyprenyl-3-methyl-5-hydroxy-6-metoxy-1,4-benzoquinol methylase|nr:class I SAM-dependent methyltransferase [Bacteroidota bacterium]MDA1175637.1 class I SAM-dependent methyltransferase [Bacteroidota bacterium]